MVTQFNAVTVKHVEILTASELELPSAWQAVSQWTIDLRQSKLAVRSDSGVLFSVDNLIRNNVSLFDSHPEICWFQLSDRGISLQDQDRWSGDNGAAYTQPNISIFKLLLRFTSDPIKYRRVRLRRSSVDAYGSMAGHFMYASLHPYAIAVNS